MFNAIFRLAFTSVTGGFALNLAKNYESPAHSSTGKRSVCPRSGPKTSHKSIALSFIISFTPLWGFFFTYPSRYFSLLVTQEYLALRGGPRGFTRDFSCPKLLGKFFFFFKKKKKKRDFHPLWCRFQLLQIFLFSGSPPKGSAKRHSFVFPQPCFSV